MSAKLALIVAVAENGVIGRDNRMPWRLSSDLKRFRRLTMGKPIVMGRKTFASIGKALPGRHNIVISRDPDFCAADVEVVGSPAAALAAARRRAAADGADEIMVIGGATIYAETLDQADRLYVTQVHAAPDGDTRFPRIDPAAWRLVETRTVARGPKDSAATSFAVYERVTAG